MRAASQRFASHPASEDAPKACARYFVSAEAAAAAFFFLAFFFVGVAFAAVSAGAACSIDAASAGAVGSGSVFAVEHADTAKDRASIANKAENLIMSKVSFA